MKKEIREVEKTVKEKCAVYIANDRTVHYSELECLAYEWDIGVQKVNSVVEHNPALDDFTPLGASNKNDAIFYRWYRPHSASDVALLNEVYWTSYDESYIGTWLCVGYCYGGSNRWDAGTFEESIEYLRDYLDKFGFNVTVTPKKDTDKTNKDLYAELIAGYIMATGATGTMEGNIHIPFEMINGIFRTNLPKDKELLDKIVDSFNYDIVSYAEAVDDFDLNFYTSFCPLINDEDDDKKDEKENLE